MRDSLEQAVVESTRGSLIHAVLGRSRNSRTSLATKGVETSSMAC